MSNLQRKASNFTHFDFTPPQEQALVRAGFVVYQGYALGADGTIVVMLADGLHRYAGSANEYLGGPRAAGRDLLRWVSG